MAAMSNSVTDSIEYRNAPIVEAIIHIQVTFPDDGSAPALSRSERIFSSRFARGLPLQRVNFQITSVEAQQPSSSVSHEAAGWKFTSERNDRVLQVLPDAFVYSHLNPYSNWRTFSTEARQLWNDFVEGCSPEKVTRIGLRYINRLRIPAQNFELAEYLNFFPTTPVAFGPVHGLVSQVQLPQPGIAPDAIALVTIASEPSADPSTSAFALDLDVFTRSEFSATDSRIWEVLEDFRLRKNQLFEAVLTENMRGTIK